ncbi:MAG TPA: hypothetical protein VFY61_11350 [Pyrinomonadaceae bacterium]|nr:hypothetical protein [Pyrinomonadaceae bacterium]
MTRKQKSNGHKTETPDVSHIRNIEVEHETSDVSVRGVATFVAVLTVTTIVISIGMWFLFRYFDAQEAKQRPAGPMALSQQDRLPPEPRLQAAPGFEVKLEDGQTVRLENREPQAEYRILKEQWEKALRGELKDQSGNSAVPIDRAIDQVVSGGGLPTRPQDDKKNYWIDMPTAWSSGRTTEKKMQ